MPYRPYMDALKADLRYAFRCLAQAPAFYALVVGILALGIAAAVSVFSLVDGVLLRPLPYRDPARLVTLTSYAPKPPFESNGSVSYHDFQQFQSLSHSFAGFAVTFRDGWSRVTLTGGTEPIAVQGAFVSPNLFSLFGRSPLLGRTFTSEENQRTERVVVISQALWEARYGSSPQVLGQSLEIGHTPWRIIGVMPNDFQIPFLGTQLWAPVLSHPEWNDKEERHPLDSARWDLLARLKPGVSLVTAQGEVNSLWSGLRSAMPEEHTNDIRVTPLREHFTGRARAPLLVLLSAVSFLLLIACANVANLLLARIAEREGEIAIRAALGAASFRLLRQLLAESTLLSSIGGALGVLGSLALVPALKALSPADTPLLDGVTVDFRSLIFALTLSMSLGLLVGILPAWRVLRGGLGPFLNATSRRSTESRGSRRLKSLLVAAEFALAMVLVTGSSLLIRSFVAVRNVDLGFHPENVLTVQMGLPEATLLPRMVQQYSEMMGRIARLPGVSAVGGASNIFFLNETRTHALRLVEGRPPEPQSAWKQLVWSQISGDYFQAMGIPLVRGRFFNASDRPDGPPVAIVNETLARRYWPDSDAVGKHLKGFDPRGPNGGKNDDWLTVVGVVKDARSGGAEKNPFSQIYEVQSQRGDQINNMVIRTEGDPLALASAARAAIRGVNRESMVSSINTVEQLLNRQETQRRFETWLIGLFSALALALAGLGVFAVMRYAVAAKTAEIGIRMAVGADAGDVLRLVLGGGARLAIAGIAAGGLAALWLTDAIRGMLFNVRPDDFFSFASAALALCLIALLACYFPARHASHIDPIVALREN